MSKVRLILLSMLAVFAASAIASASASANNGCLEVGGEKCLWTLNGAALPTGEMRTVKVIWNSTQTLKGKVGSFATTLTSKLIELEKAAILGGIPGTNYGKIAFKNVVVVTPKECKVTNDEVKTNALKSELVELVKAGTPEKVDDVLFEPEVTGTNFATITFENNPKLTGKCPINGLEANVQGDIQAEPKPRKTETKLLTLKAQGKEKWEFRRQNSPTVEKSELKLGGLEAIYEGTSDLGLADGLNWGTD
jgi:hypothetical protein